MDVNTVQKLLDRLKNFPKHTHQEKNIFSIGARGHYENPITDILAFFCDTNEEHGFGDTILRAFLAALLEKSEDFSSCVSGCRVIREVYTHDGKRIDMLLEGDDWVLTVENKIYHKQNNPFNYYSNYISENYKNKKQLYVALSPYGTSPKNVNVTWHGLTYASLIESIEKYFCNHCLRTPINKWQIIFREFLLHLKELTMTQPLRQDEVSFLISEMENLAEIAKFKCNTAWNLFDEIKKHLITAIPSSEVVFSNREAYWFPQARFFLSVWKDKPSQSHIFLNSENMKMSIAIDLKRKDYTKEQQVSVAENNVIQSYSKKLTSSFEEQFLYFFIHDISNDHDLDSLKNAALKGFKCLMNIEQQLS